MGCTIQVTLHLSAAIFPVPNLTLLTDSANLDACARTAQLGLVRQEQEQVHAQDVDGKGSRT